MKFKRSAPAVLISTIVVVVLVSAWVSNQMFSGMTDDVERRQFDQMERILTRNLKAAAGKAQARAELVASLPATRRLLAAKDRDGLLAEYGEMFAIQHERHEVAQMQFALPPATALLKLHLPDAPTEDMSSFRPLIVATNRDQLAQTGISVARAGPAVFAVVPVHDDAGKHLGIFEVGVDIGPVLDGLKASFGLELGFFVDEEILRRVATNAPPEIFSEENRVGHYLRVHATHAELIKELARADDIDGLEESRRVVYRALGNDYGVLLVPIRDPAGLPMGVMVVASDFAETRAAAGRSLVWQGLIALFGIVLLAGVVLVVLRGFLLRPIQAIAEGKPVEDDVVCDEVRELARGYAELRAQAGLDAPTSPSHGGDAP